MDYQLSDEEFFLNSGFSSKNDSFIDYYYTFLHNNKLLNCSSSSPKAYPCQDIEDSLACLSIENPTDFYYPWKVGQKKRSSFNSS